MNVVRHSPKKRQGHARSATSSSVSSYDVPRTPIDSSYAELHEGRLGQDFSLIKMRQPLVEDDDGMVSECNSNVVSSARYPDTPVLTYLL